MNIKQLLGGSVCVFFCFLFTTPSYSMMRVGVLTKKQITRLQKGERRIVTFFKGWRGNVLLTSSGPIDTTNVLVHDPLDTKHKKWPKGHIYVEIVYKDGKITKVIIRR